MSDFKVGDVVKFKPGPKASGTVKATVTSIDGHFLTTKDADDKVRKVRPGSAVKVG